MEEVEEVGWFASWFASDDTEEQDASKTTDENPEQTEVETK